MPDLKLINLPEKTTPEDADILITEDVTSTKRITFANLLKPIKNIIGNLASLTTSHKSTIVGAINELKARDGLRQGGFETVTLVSGSTVRKRVNFSRSYTSKPKINLTTETSSPHRSDVSVTDIDLNGFDIAAQADWSGNMTVHWFAQP